MTAGRQQEGLQPLRGPLGWRELFFLRGSAPILAFVRMRRVWVGALIVIAGLTWLAYALRREPDARDVFLLGELLAWLGLEGVCFLYGLRLSWCASRWQRRRRIAELALTGLRPIEIGQWILARGIWSTVWLFLVAVAALCALQVAAFGEYAYFLLGYVAIAIDTVLTLYMMHWMQLTLFLSAKSWMQGFLRQLAFQIVHNTIGALFVGVYITLLILIEELFHLRSRSMYWLCNIMVYPAIIPFWLVKYRFTRAWAERLERAVFHRVEY